MKQAIIVFIVCLVFQNSIALPLKILHLSFHKGCINDIEEMGKELGLSITSWFVLESKESLVRFDDQHGDNRIYNMSHERAERIWQKNKEYFDTFDVVITSDTAPLARIFLQNNWQKPLIIWVCNRFDYNHDGSDPFPDAEFYELFRTAHLKKNVTMIPYTCYEEVYAAKKKVLFNHKVIKPLGRLSQSQPVQSNIPTTIDKQETLFIYPRLEAHTIQSMTHECAIRGIKTYSGVYNGPDDLADFKGIIFVPYAWSNLALFENFQQGIIHFVPRPSMARRFTIFPQCVILN